MYTYFNPTKKVLCAIQIVEDASASEKSMSTVFPHEDDEIINEAEDDSAVDTDKPIAASIMTLYRQDEEVLDMPVSKLIKEDLIVNEFGSVKGTLKYVTNFTGFSSKLEEQNGYYIPFRLSKTTGTTMSLIKNGIVTKMEIPFDHELVLRVDGPETVWEVEVDNETAIKLYFGMAKFEPKQ